MSTFERDDYKWRETYFVLFDDSRRPTLKAVERAIRELNARFELSGGTADDEGRFESVTVLSPDDYAALDISYMVGEEVREAGAAFYEEMREGATDSEEAAKIERLLTLDARFDLLHFEQVTASSDDDPDELLDPSTLLVVLETLVDLTHGVGVDPQSGTVL